MECEMCGSAKGLKKAWVEGTLLHVCERCAKFGSVVEESAALPARKSREPEIKESVIEPDFATMVRDARMSSGMTVEGLSGKISISPSVLNRIERGMRPTDEVASRLEKALRIKLLGACTEGRKTSVPAHHLTLGDIAEIRVRKK
ncbi:MAG: TIGR00270 family protein [Candidatus Aenigmarchaeota archaeon]|nr:TIGR00270 family protein [Candidatus Aenigmarchaeota archaeon]